MTYIIIIANVVGANRLAPMTPLAPMNKIIGANYLAHMNVVNYKLLKHRNNKIVQANVPYGAYMRDIEHFLGKYL